MNERYSVESINSSTVDDMITGLKPLDLGNDSTVFRLGSFVVKQYWMLKLNRIEIYEQITNGFAQALASQFPEFQTSGHGKVKLKVEPILKVFNGEKTQQTYSLSRYVEGVRPTDDKDESLGEMLYKYSIGLEAISGYSGIYVLASNTKILRGVCTITDICGRVALLNPK